MKPQKNSDTQSRCEGRSSVVDDWFYFSTLTLLIGWHPTCKKDYTQKILLWNKRRQKTEGFRWCRFGDSMY